ncbi:DNA-binding transcriptional LysR family regulator [Peptoniphilus ivorii]|uniref:selenium metabolism-associated LysR family transcriptional regulator n=1 Tax=Aedoeadaptatus ivorii TaxID=54006 RepID=UPI002781D2F3|nr:selenium metabolism-associated LysR family transcriptional regulator [Peptoniphilus ivorii]MDQ0507990.1 DNA-binding transcriptional LysR family regulator [Peptoniphilus ivorii]
MDFKQINAFVNVAKYKSFSRAADASFLTQPTISAHVISLEKELGVILLNRNRGEAILTDEGKKLYKYAVNLINVRDEAIREVKQEVHEEVAGVLSMQVSSVIGESWIPKHLVCFREEHPYVRFFIDQSDSDIVENNLLSGQGDLGFLGKKPNSALGSERVLTDPLVLICPKNEKYKTLYKKYQSLSIKEILGEQFIWREEGSATRRQFEKEVEKLGYSSYQWGMSALLTHIESIKKCVELGLGISVISKISAWENYEARDYLIFKIKELHMTRDFYMVWNKNVTLSQQAQAFKKYIHEKAEIQ